jgi:hypothetical protein
MCSAWRGQDPRPGGRWINVDELKTTNDGSQKSDGKGIEYVEQSALEKILNNRDPMYEFIRAKSRLFGPGWSKVHVSEQSMKSPTISSSSTSPESTSSTYGKEGFRKRFQSHTNSNPESEYEIDPITNRKVFKNKSSKSVENNRKPIEVPVKTFKGYRSQFQDLTPPTEKPSDAELKSYQPFLYNEPDAKLPQKPDPVRESLKDYEGDGYKPFFYNEPDGKPSKKCDPVEDGLKDYDSQTSYGAFRHNEPDGKLPDKTDPVQQGLEDYDSAVSYTPFFHNEPDGKPPALERKCSVQEGLKDYDSKAYYGAFRYNEPDGKSPQAEQPDLVQEGLKEFDSQNSYGAFRHNEPNGKPLTPQRPDPVQEGLKDFDGQASYSAFRRNEPDGKPPPNQGTSAEGLRDFDRRANYGPAKTTIQDRIKNFLGRRSRALNNCYPNDVDTTEDLDLLRPSDVRAASGIIKGPKKETEADKLAKRSKLEDDFHKPRGLEMAYAAEVAAAQKAMEAKNLTAENLAESVKDAKNRIAKKLGDLEIENSELQNHVSHARGRVNAKIAEIEARWLEQSPQRNVTGNFDRDLPEEFEAVWTAEKSGSGSSTLEKKTAALGYDESPKRLEFLYQQEVENIVQKAEREHIDGSASKESFARNSETPQIQTSLDRSAAPAQDKAAAEQTSRVEAEAVPYSKVPRGLETSYAEECASSCSAAAEKDPYSKIPQGLETSYAEECAKTGATETKEPEKMSRLQAEIDPYSKIPMGLETCYTEECAQQGEGGVPLFVSSYGTPKRDDDAAEKNGSDTLEARKRRKHERKQQMKQSDQELVCEVRNIYEETYGTIDCQHRQVPEPPKAAQVAGLDSEHSAIQEPTVYKILAYDPTMQSISTAETTSIVNDSASALTPAEVLLRLSNPAKFFPHFEPLKSQGYEIVSGSGDVLVFRKVRAAAAPSSLVEERKRKSTNPIDGMQSSPVVATGNFASPTGFVNHDLPGGSEPPFKSNIDVRREEPVFSGKSNWQDGTSASRQKTGGKAKRLLIGAAWVGACSYAIGVVAEFFRTGGMDGKGPQGF